MTPTITLDELLGAPGGRAIVERYLSIEADGAVRSELGQLLVAAFIRVTPGLRDDPVRQDKFWSDVAAAVTPKLPQHHADEVSTSRHVGDAAQPAASAPWRLVGEPTQWGLIEIAFEGPSCGNPFVDVELSVRLSCGDRSWTAGGFYDGDGVYRVRALAEVEGAWEFTTSSTDRCLNGIDGSFVVGAALSGAHGPVQVDGLHFRYADGRRYLPWGTTAYAWIYQSPQQQAATLDTLKTSAFTKLRMCLFPKHFVYNRVEPERVPFVRDADGGIDVTRFDVAFFARLDDQIRELAALGIQADLILFHPYDRWGFAKLGPVVDDRLVRYVVRRLAGYANIWWSLANEYDLILGKSIADWDRIGELIVAEDVGGHPVSIHNFQRHFDHSRSWITHASVQSGTTEEIGAWRDAWSKPVVVDECGYEGDLEWGWGNLSGEELLRRLWEAAVRGGYAGHGETYWHPDHKIFWSKGGRLTGTCHDRIGFLNEIVAASPTGVLEPLPSDFDPVWGGAQDRYLVSYHGAARPRERHVLLPPGRWQVEVLDTWLTTVRRLPGLYETFVLVPLDAKPFQAIRLVATPAPDTD